MSAVALKIICVRLKEHVLPTIAGPTKLNPTSAIKSAVTSYT